MKRIFVAFISTAIVLCLSLNSVFAKVFPDIDPNEELEKAVEALYEYGIIDGYEDGTYRPDETITREEVCAILTRIMPARNMSATLFYVDFFTDVSQSSWSYEYILAMVQMGIVNGYDDNTFRPDRDITYQEFIKMVMSMLFYKPYAEENGKYPDGYLKAAELTGITKDIIFKNDENITRKDVAIIVNRMLEIEFLLVDEYSLSDENKYDTASGNTYKKVLLNSSNDDTTSNITDKTIIINN